MKPTILTPSIAATFALACAGLPALAEDHSGHDHPAPQAAEHAEHAGHAEHTADAKEAAHSGHAHHHAAPEADTRIPETSLYQLDSTWTNQDGKSVKWADGKGTLRVVTLGYSRCPDICPRLIADMQRIERALSEEERQQVKFTFISIDSAHDDAAALKDLATRHKVDAEHWEFLTGKKDKVLEIAAAIGVRYDAYADGSGFSHSYLITSMDRDGKILNKWSDASKPETDSVQALRKALSK